MPSKSARTVGYSPSTKGFYVIGLHKTCPEDTVFITPERHQSILELHYHHGHEIYTRNGHVMTRSKTYSLEELRQRATRRINEQAQAKAKELSRGHAQTEVDTWPIQEQEAQQVLQDATRPTPLLEAIAAAREISIAELANKVVTKANARRLELFSIEANRQRLQMDIEKAFEAGDSETIKEISFP